MASKNALLRFFLVSNSGIIFGMPFFKYFCYFGWIWALILAPFWHNFAYFSHAFFLYRFCIDSVMFFHDFLDVQNHVFYCKTNSFVHFSLFQKSMNFHRFWFPFWHHFGNLLTLIFNTFSIWDLACLFQCLFHNFFGINFCMLFLNFYSASDACFCQCLPVSCIK